MIVPSFRLPVARHRFPATYGPFGASGSHYFVTGLTDIREEKVAGKITTELENTSPIEVILINVLSLIVSRCRASNSVTFLLLTAQNDLSMTLKHVSKYKNLS